MKPTHDTAHVAEGLDFLLAQYRGQPNLTGLTESFLEAAQEIEDAIWDVIASQQLSRVIPPGPPDQALLQLADLVGCPTAGLSGPELGFLLGIWLLARRSKGRSEDLITILATAFPGLYIYEEYFPAAYEAWVVDVPDVVLVPLIAQALRIARPPAVHGVLAWGDWPTATFFFGDSAAPSAGSGFEDSVSTANAMGLLSAIEV